jgi:DNA uptake protein ComE-like DNA-binding protein
MRLGAGRPGFALLAVLWALVILGGLSLRFHGIARADRIAAANARTEAQARWAARAGFAHALSDLERRLASFTPLGTAGARGDTLLPPLEILVDRVPAVALVLDHRARLNVNTASLEAISTCFAAAGIPAARADVLAAATVERRRQALFRAVRELREVEGIGAGEYRLIEPHLTTVGDGRVNVNTATVPALSTIPGVDAATAARIVERRARAPFANVYELFQAMEPGARRAAMDDTEELLGGVAFSPRTLAILVAAGEPRTVTGAELYATVELLGGPNFAVVAVAERPVRNPFMSPGVQPGEPARRGRPGW